MIASLPYGPPVNTDIDYYLIFSDFFILNCKYCNVSLAIFVRRSEASACLIILSTKQGNHWYHFFNAFGMARPEFEPTTPDPEAGVLALSHRDRETTKPGKYR